MEKEDFYRLLELYGGNIKFNIFILLLFQPLPVPVPNKRKLKQQCEAPKVPNDVRQRYVNMFTEEFLKTEPSVSDAVEKVSQATKCHPHFQTTLQSEYQLCFIVDRLLLKRGVCTIAA